jgi:hypothetical protein
MNAGNGNGGTQNQISQA